MNPFFQWTLHGLKLFLECKSESTDLLYMSARTCYKSVVWEKQQNAKRLNGDCSFYIYGLLLLAGKISFPICELTPLQATHNSAAAASAVSAAMTTAKPRGAELDRVLKVGDRVRKNPNCFFLNTQVRLLFSQRAHKPGVHARLESGRRLSEDEQDHNAACDPIIVTVTDDQ